jgi:excinuclease ABC subunit A
MAHDWIAVRGARVHNLRNIDVDLPRDQIVVITGLSGSGKSSLAFDTVYAEGQRRYVESLSAYARQFLEQMEKPDVDLIDGLSPAISIEQKTTAANPRSTVGTVTEIYDYLRLLFANIGVPHCPNCDREIASQSLERIMDMVLLYPDEERVNVLAPIVRGRKGEFKRDLAALRGRGFTRARIDGTFVSLDDEIALDRRRNHTVEVLVDRLVIKTGIERRLMASIDLALSLADDIVVINTLDGGDRLFSRRLACPSCDLSVPEMTPRAFSFNSPHGACPTCQGLGEIYDFDARRVVPDDTRSLADGAIAPWAAGDRKSLAEMLDGLQRTFGIDASTPFGKLSKKHRDVVLYGAPGRTHTAKRRGGKRDPFGADFEGVIPSLRRRFDTGSWSDQEALEPYRALLRCPACGGDRLKPESRAVRVKGRRITEYVHLPLSDAVRVFESLDLTEREQLVAGRVLREIQDRLRFLVDVGVGYLTLARSAVTLSGGEGQRIRLATQIGSQLTGVL